jgi:hypothetical protein
MNGVGWILRDENHRPGFFIIHLAQEGRSCMADFKTISRDAVPLALKKAERYRLLNEPAHAESICLDVLAVDPENQEALVMLILALTDQFQPGRTDCFRQAEAVVPRLRGEYERYYYSGIIHERRASARASQGGPGSETVAYQWVRQAMDFYEQAERIRPRDNDDALLRWNSCLRLCQRHQLHPELQEMFQPVLGDD